MRSACIESSEPSHRSSSWWCEECEKARVGWNRSKADGGRCSGRECQVEIGTRSATRVTPSLTVTWRRLLNVGVRQCGIRGSSESVVVAKFNDGSREVSNLHALEMARVKHDGDVRMFLTQDGVQKAKMMLTVRGPDDVLMMLRCSGIPTKMLGLTL